ncbi:MAG: hypothetical protein LC114_03655, partial [Bryobacterales bacterium]|nr:hypothetical protein [Bryobacterales bacterium]
KSVNSHAGCLNMLDTRRLFPDDDPLVKTLEPHYDECSKAMHSSVYGLAHYLAQPRTSTPLFDIGTDAKLVATFMTVVDVHLTMIRVFHRLLSPYVGRGIEQWNSELNTLSTTYRTKHAQWGPVIVAESQRLKGVVGEASEGQDHE